MTAPDQPPGSGSTPTAAGAFRLRPVRLPADLALLTRWMNDPEVDAFWELAGPPAATERHVRAQLDGDGRSLPCLGLLDETPMSYWEVYRADLDPIAAHYPARPHDTGLHLLLGPAESRGRGLGAVLLAAVAARVLRERPRCERVVAEPDVRNRRSVRAFERAGFRLAAELDLPGKRAALMVRDRLPEPVADRRVPEPATDRRVPEPGPARGPRPTTSGGPDGAASRTPSAPAPRHVPHPA